MKRFIAAGVVALLAFSAALARQDAPKADFTGAWTLDLAKSEGLPPSFKGQKLTVKHAGDRVEVEAKTTLEEGDRTDSDVYTLDGKAAAYAPKGPGGIEGKGKRTSAWSADGRGMDVKETATFDTPMGAVDVSFTRKWALSADGKTLTIETHVESTMGSQTIKRTLTKD